MSNTAYSTNFTFLVLHLVPVLVGSDRFMLLGRRFVVLMVTSRFSLTVSLGTWLLNG